MSGRRWATVAAVVTVAAVTVTYGFIEGNRFSRREIRIRLGAGPLVGRYEPRINLGTLLAVVAAAVVVIGGPLLARRLAPRMLALATGVSTSVFTVVLASNDSRRQMLDPVTHPTEYWQAVATAPPLGEFVDTYVEALKGYSVHLRGHPPGYTALLLAGRAVGVTDPWLVAALSWVAAGVAAAAVVVAVRHIAGHDQAAIVAPVLAVAPYAVWAGTSADAVYAAFGAVGVASLVIAGHAAQLSTRRRWLWAAAGGGLLGMLLFGTYGAVMLAPLAVLVIAAARRPSLLVPGVGAVALVVLGWLAAGFWWLDGATATREEYWLGTAQFREAWRFAAFNVAALLIALGPVVVLSAAFVRCRSWLWLVAGAAVGVVAANASQYSKGEVERIWLIFMPWLTVAVIGLLHQRPLAWQRVAIGTQAATAIAIQTVLVSKW